MACGDGWESGIGLGVCVCGTLVELDATCEMKAHRDLAGEVCIAMRKDNEEPPRPGRASEECEGCGLYVCACEVRRRESERQADLWESFLARRMTEVGDR